MKIGDIIDFSVPRSNDFMTGRIESFTVQNGTRMPVVTDHIDMQYPVHPANITDTLKT